MIITRVNRLMIMIKSLTDIIQYLLKNSLFIFFAGTFAGVIIQKLIDAFFELFLKIHKRKLFQRLLKNVNNISTNTLNIKTIIGCNDCYIGNDTIKISDAGVCLFLSPPQDINTQRRLNGINSKFKEKDILFDSNIKCLAEENGISDLRQLIKKHKAKIAEDYIYHRNGCYFNNLKFGIYDVNPFARTEDKQEKAKIEIKTFTTDYYTHRVIKSIYKDLLSQGRNIVEKSDKSFSAEKHRFFLTSLGINLALIGKNMSQNQCVLLTKRSTNATETYNEERISMSVIEGVSITDYDEYQKIVDLNLAAKRGLLEELGIRDNLIKCDEIKYYELFINLDNFEVGIACSVEIKDDKCFERDIIEEKGKDELLEVADKMIVELKDVVNFVSVNRDNYLPQALYSIGIIMAHYGINIFSRWKKT